MRHSNIQRQQLCTAHPSSPLTLFDPHSGTLHCPKCVIYGDRRCYASMDFL